MQYEDLAKSILFQHLERASIEERAAAKAEEARRRREAELRRARKKEQMARDPKRKVALKIENKRREEEMTEATGTCTSYNTLKGFGFIDMGGVTVFVHHSQCEEGKQPKRALTFTGKEKSSEALDASLFQSEIPADLSREERAIQLRKERYGMKSAFTRMRNAVAHQQDKYLNHLIDKMSRLRSEWKYMLPFDLDLASSGFTDATGERTDSSCRW
eukprot:g33687.t1